MLSLFISFSFLTCLFAQEKNYAKKANYEEWCVGNCNIDVVVETQPGTIFVGGGVDPDEAFQWHIRNANHGDFLILSAADYDDEYNDYVYQMSIDIGMPLNSVRTIEFQNRLASYDEDVLQWIRNAEGIFFEGGDQSRYINWWVGTDVQSIIQNKLPDVTIGGTSAGLAILGNWVYSAEEESVESVDALQNPYNSNVTIADAFLHINYLQSVITDTHFYERDRMGRMLTFVARILQDNPNRLAPIVRGIGVDEPAGLIINATSGFAQAVGNGSVYICSSLPLLNPEKCSVGEPLTFLDIGCTRLSADNRDTYSLATWSTETVGTSKVYTDNIQNGSFVGNAYGF